MPAVSILEPEQWAEIEKAYILAVPPAEIADKYGVEVNAIHQRAHRFKWPSPHRIAKERALLKQNNSNGLSSSNSGNVSDCKPKPSARQMAAETITELGKRAQIAVLSGLVPEIETALQSPGDFRPTNLDELGKASTIVMKMAGLDKPQVQLAVALSPGWGTAVQADGQGGDWSEDGAET